MNARTIFVGTLPILIVTLGLLGTMIWNLIEVKSLRQELRELTKKVGELAERISRLEGKIEGRHVVLE